MLRPLALVLLLLAARAEDPTPLAAAQAAFEAERSDEHRSRMRLTWDRTERPMPARLDVLMLSGYLNHDLLLLQWRDGRVAVHAARVDRQWFYHAKPNSRAYATAVMSPAEFTTFWRTIHHLITLQAEEIAPKEGFGSHRSLRSSHESEHLLTWRQDGDPSWSALPVVRGANYRDDIRDLGEMKMSVIRELVWHRFPRDSWTPDPTQATAAHWRDWWRAVLPGCHGDGVNGIDARSRLLVDNACEMLGDTGEANDALILEAVAASLRPSRPRDEDEPTGSTYREDSLRDDIARCRERITLRLAWDSATAARAIHANDGRTYADDDQERWLREQFHRHDPDGYRTMLLTDLQVGEAMLTVRSTRDLAERFPGQHQAELHRLLRRAEPEVVLAGAMALLGQPAATGGWDIRPESVALCERATHEPLLHDAFTAIARLAGDPTVPTRPAQQWFNPSPRTQAIDLLGSCPPPWGWDEARCRAQVADPREVDARIIAHLLPRLHLSLQNRPGAARQEPSAEERATLIAIWRRCLVTPPTRGTVLALEQLIALRDVDSLPRLREVRDLLRAGASPIPFDDHSRARLPWISRFEVDDLDQQLAALEASAP